MYADTDFFLALLKEEDWLKNKAQNIYKKHKKEIWASPVALIELLLLSETYDIDPEDLIVTVSQLVRLEDGNLNVFLLAAHYIKEKDLNVFDALHAAFCGKDKIDKIISSDKKYDELGMKRIKLEK